MIGECEWYGIDYDVDEPIDGDGTGCYWCDSDDHYTEDCPTVRCGD